MRFSSRRRTKLKEIAFRNYSGMESFRHIAQSGLRLTCMAASYRIYRWRM